MPTRPPLHQAPGFRTPEARAREAETRRPSARARGYTHQWDEAARAFLAEHPTCACEACALLPAPRPAQVVDHVRPHKGNASLFWNTANWQPMSKACHDAKTAREDGGFGHPLRPGPRGRG